MIDLSHLTEEEQEMIMTVLNRDTELKRAEEERIKHLQKLPPEEGRLKYMTGEWFYEAKSQRHSDRIHGSEIIMASMNQKTPKTLEVTQSWFRNISNRQKDNFQPKPPEHGVDPSDQLQHRENSTVSLESQQEQLKLAMRSPSKQRHNPFNSVPVELDSEETDRELTNGASGPTKSPDAELLSPLKSRKASPTDIKPKSSATSNSKPTGPAPVPKKRTIMYQGQNSLSDSSEPSSGQSNAAGSGSNAAGSRIRSPAPRGILKQGSSCSSGESNNKRQHKSSLSALPPAPSSTALGREPEDLMATSERAEGASAANSQHGQPTKFSSSLSNADKVLELRYRPKLHSRLHLDSATQSDNSPVDTLHRNSQNSQAGNEKPVHPRTGDHKPPAMSAAKPKSPKPTEREGDSIAKVLEWFSKSMDNTDRLDTDSCLQDMEETKGEPVDLEDAVNPTSKAAENVFSIVPRRREETTPKLTSMFQQSVDEPEPSNEAQSPKPEIRCDVESFREKSPIFNPPIHSSLDTKKAYQPKLRLSAAEQSPKKDKEVKAMSKTEEDYKMSGTLGNTGILVTQQGVSESMVHEEKSSPKKSNLKSFWEKGDSGPKIITTRTNLNAENANKSLNQTEVGKKERELHKVGQSSRGNAPAPENVEEKADEKYTSRLKSGEERRRLTLRKQITVNKDYVTDVPLSLCPDQRMEKIMIITPSEGDVTTPPKLDSGCLQEGQYNETMTSTSKSILIIEGSPAWSARLETEPRAVEHQEEPQSESSPLSWPSTHMQPGPGLTPRQGLHQQDSKVLRIKHLKSFWESEESEPKIDVGKQSWTTESKFNKSSTSSPAKLNKRFTKSEFDLRTLGTDLDDDEDDDGHFSHASDKQSYNFTVLTMKDRIEKSSMGEGINNTQFKSLRDFWGGSPSKLHEPKSPPSEERIQQPKSPQTKLQEIANTFKQVSQSAVESKPYMNPNDYPNVTAKQSETANAKSLWDGNQYSKASPSALVKANRDKEQQPPLKERQRCPDAVMLSGIDATRCASLEPQQQKVSRLPQLRRGSQRASTRDLTAPKDQVNLGKESQLQQARRTSKGSLNGRASALRHATSMYAMNIDEGQDQASREAKKTQDINLAHSKKTQEVSLEQLKNTQEVSLAQSKKTQEVSLAQSKKTQEVVKSKERSLRASDESESQQPRARSLIPRDYQHYLGITENASTHTPPIAESRKEMVCTSFTAEPELDTCRLSGPVRASTPLASEEVQGRRGSQGLPSSWNIRPSDDGNPESSKSSTSETWSRSWEGSKREDEDESLVQGALRRAAARPVFTKSLEDITSSLPTRQEGDSNVLDGFMHSSDEVSTVPSLATSSFSDPEHVKKMSKSVPSFLQKESDGGESDSTSESSFKPQKIGRSLTNVSDSSGMASVSSVSGSLMSVYSGDFGGVEVQGTIQFTLSYVQKMRELHVFVVQCRNLAVVDAKRNRSDPYVKSYLMPDKANLGKRKTSVKKKTLNPTYNEILRYRVRMEYLKSQTLNLSVWHNDTFGRNNFLGEVEVDLSTWDFSNSQMNHLSLNARTLPSLQPSDFRGEMRLAVRFLPQISHSKTSLDSGEVHIWVKDCKNLPLIRGATIDPYVKCFVLPDTSRKSRQKTRVLKRTASPVFNHTMVYDGFRPDDLKDACVELTVWDQDRLANHLLGGVRLGLGKGRSYGAEVDWMDSTSEEVTLWERMMDFPNEWVEDVLPLRMLMTAKNV